VSVWAAYETNAHPRERFPEMRIKEDPMRKQLSVIMFLCAGMTLAIPLAMAQTAAVLEKETPKKEAAKLVKKTAKKAPEGVDDDKQSDIAGFSSTNFNCELGNKITVYENDSDNNHIKLRWNKQVYELKRVATSTGAKRFEDSDTGLVWIHIPAKGMLLDSKRGQQLTNECRSRGK
jgi:hypothetical protein